MCGCSTPQDRPSDPARSAKVGTHQHRSDHAAGNEAAVLSLRVEDMTCGHCAGAIAKAIEGGLPGTSVDADPASKIVRVRGPADRASVHALVAGAGYTPSMP